MYLMIIILLTFVPHLVILENSNRNLSWADQKIQIYKEHTFFYKDKVKGCFFKENTVQSIVLYGPQCDNYPTNYQIHKLFFKIKITSIRVIKINDFVKLGHLNTLIFESNPYLYKFEPGCFKPMRNLTDLSFRSNINLKYLDANVFEGLINLKQITFKKNGFKHIPDISNALSVNFLPNIKSLDLSEHLFKNILKDDFSSLKNTTIDVLVLSFCGLASINENSLLVFKNLKSLDLGQNHLSINSTKQILSKFIEFNISLSVLYLYGLGYRHSPPKQLLEVIAKTNITTLSLADNQFEKLTYQDFPLMPNLKSLDLSKNILISMDSSTFNGLPNLEELYLAENKFTNVSSAVLLPQLKVLDLRMISGREGAMTYLNIENNIFKNMKKLTILRLSYNMIQTTTEYTFTGLENLMSMDLKNANLFNVEPGSFENNHKLVYLNLENNFFQAITLTHESFRGLYELETLRLGGCNFINMTTEPSLFQNLTKLTFLGLNSNIIYTLHSKLFEPLVSLTSLNLSSNQLIPWTDRLFSNLSLKFIDVSQNKLTFLTSAMLSDLKTVENVNLEGNPFICDCNLLPTNISLDTLLNRNYSAILDSICTNIKWDQKTLRDYIMHLKSHPNECSKYFSRSMVTLILSTVFFIILVIVSILSYVYRYYLRYWIFLMKIAIQRNSKWWKKQSNQSVPFKYDAFVSYSCMDCYFVNKLVSELEDNEPYLKLCVYERDFKIGSVISEEVLQSVLTSRRTLLIISEGFAKSQWCRWETKLAEYHQIFFQNDDGMRLDDTLVMIKLNDVQKKYITPTLKYLMKTRIYLQWDAENECEFWEKLRHTLSAPKCIKNKSVSETTL